MNKPLFEGRALSLTSVAAAALLLVHVDVSALSLGRLTVQSTLGEALRAEIDITNITPEEAASLRASLASPEAFRAAGVDFNAALAGAQTTLVKRPDGRSVIRLTGDRTVGEPFLDVVLDFNWSSGRLQRAYTLLIDPPARTVTPPPAAPAVSTPPAMAAAAPLTPSPPPPPAPPPVQATPRPVTPPPPPPVRAPVPPPPPASAVVVKPAPAPVTKPAPAAPAPTATPMESASTDGYRVRRGDTLSGIAASRAGAGVSLDQMLVSLYRGNPQAFSGNNMNRLRSGVVLNLPDAQAARSISTAEARQVIQAHSADFSAFRRQLAGAVPTVPSSEPPRQSTGKVEAAIDDRKAAAAAPAPDKLTLSRGAAASAEASLSKDTERKAAEARVAELARNVDELKKLSTASLPASAAPAGKAAAVAAVASAPAAPPVSLNVPVPSPVVASMPAAVPPEPASQVVPAAPEPASAPQVALAPAEASVPASLPVPPVAEQPTPGFMESLSSSPYVLPVAVGLVALLAGVGLMRVRRRSQDATGETSFLESKLQPDSFFGVSGGQRVDTRDADGGAPSSSLSYSLSQLDAIGDVDPVAEADVYLAYGRDLQAEEILKEALRTDPGRAAIRTKLLEVYAKRVDLPAFEAQAEQLREVVGDDGDDWLRAQAMGRQLDPGNPLYGVHPETEVDIDTSSEPPPDLRAEPSALDAEVTDWSRPLPDLEKTLPLDEPAAKVDDGALDLDIDLEAPALSGLEATRPAGAELLMSGDEAEFVEPGARVEDDVVSLLDDEPLRRDPPDSAPVDFDFGDLSLDLESEPARAPAAAADITDLEPKAAAVPQTAAAAVNDDDMMDSALGDEGEVDGDDPLARKLELADEFRRIGDTEGARDLLEEVINQAEGSLRAKAQAMLDGLG